VHHDDYFKDIVTKITTQDDVLYKLVYTTNEDRYLAVLPKFNKLPGHLEITSLEILEDLTK
jgi:dTDP-4-dehydrorhamnose reductase